MQVLFNVAELLKGPRGATRDFDIDEGPLFELSGARLLGRVQGSVRLMRTQQGVLVQADLAVEAEVSCARCLKSSVTRLAAHIDEEFRPTVDVLTGERIYPDPEESLSDDVLITSQHILDLDEPARQEFEVAIPLKPLCQAECAGLCQTCGQDLNEGPCGCQSVGDSRWGALSGLLDEGATQ